MSTNQSRLQIPHPYRGERLLRRDGGCEPNVAQPRVWEIRKGLPSRHRRGERERVGMDVWLAADCPPRQHLRVGIDPSHSVNQSFISPFHIGGEFHQNDVDRYPALPVLPARSASDPCRPRAPCKEDLPKRGRSPARADNRPRRWEPKNKVPGIDPRQFGKFNSSHI